MTHSRETELTLCLTEACGLLHLEARDHEDGRQMDREQRKAVAVALRAFIAAACHVTGARS